jgi:sigma-B regulation protein RsbU (phosphoserine phosphatase)
VTTGAALRRRTKISGDDTALDMATDPATEQSVPQSRILVVDDNDDNRYTLTLYLDLEGYSNVEIAHDGEEAITLLKEKSYDLVLLDVMMPKVDGYQVLSWMKDAKLVDDLPVIMISALNEIDSIVRCIELGALDYLMKPFNPVLLKARVTSSLEKKRLRDEINAYLARLTEELEAARSLQLGMVPQVFPPPTPEQPIDVFATMEPAREVGGDLYDFFYCPDGTLCFLVGDVSGKGMPAALFMARTRSLIRLAAELMRTPDGTTAGAGDIVKRVNRELCQNNNEMMFVTLFLGMLQPTTGALSFCNAGHNPPYLTADRGVQAIEGAKGTVLGVDDRADYATGTMTVAAGATIYLYTDGVTEAADPNNALFSEERLEALLRDATPSCSADLVNLVAAAVRDFAAGAEQSDDITMMAIRRL